MRQPSIGLRMQSMVSRALTIKKGRGLTFSAQNVVDKIPKRFRHIVGYGSGVVDYLLNDVAGFEAALGHVALGVGHVVVPQLRG